MPKLYSVVTFNKKKVLTELLIGPAFFLTSTRPYLISNNIGHAYLPYMGNNWHCLFNIPYIADTFAVFSQQLVLPMLSISIRK